MRNKTTYQGLSSKEAIAFITKYGYNELPSSKQRSLFRIALESVKEPMFLLLISCGSIYLLLGDIREALILLAFVFVIIGITINQERKTERALEALRDLSSPRASVIRDGQKFKIPGREVVIGDIIILEEGDRIPADAIILESLNLFVDESLLTGESAPVLKNPAKTKETDKENQSCVFSSSLVVQGRATAKVYAIGINTEIGKIGKALQSIGEEETPLKKDVDRMVKIVATAGAILCCLIVIVYGIFQSNWLKGILSGLTLAMAMIPEEFPVVLTIFLALGAWRISQKRVLTRRLPAVEALGAATVLCVDKTGTLTKNSMQVQMLCVNDSFYKIDNQNDFLPDFCHEIVEYGVLASQTDPFDPMEKAIRSLSDLFLNNTEHVHNDWEMVQEYPLSKTLLAMSRVWIRNNNKDEYVIATKGAPEAIADLCHLSKEEMVRMQLSVEKMADNGLRVIGVARAIFKPSALPLQQHDFDFEFQGLIGLTDPIREQVPSAIRECYNAGIRVIMITGDYPGTAKNIALQVGLKNIDNIITGMELDSMHDNDLCEKILYTNIFARVVPEQKLRIVNALKAIGEIVTMTGDGVNDAPALKAANIGIAMGGRGTDAARESASLVLLDDDFMSIVAAVRMGRRIFDNLKKAVSYIIAIHIPIAGLSLISALLKWPLILFPVHIVFMELIIDPACTLVFEAEEEEKNTMNRPPRDIKKPLFSIQTVIPSIIKGIILFCVVAIVFYLDRKVGGAINHARTLAFITLILGNLGLIFTERSLTSSFSKITLQKNTALLWTVIGTLFFLLLSLYVPFLKHSFKFSSINFVDVCITVFASWISILLFELTKETYMKE